jgi:hypothetical protein
MKASELKLALLILGFVKDTKNTFGTLIDSFTLEGFTIYHSEYSNNWFYIQVGNHPKKGRFKKPSKKMDTDAMHHHILNKLGIEHG